MSDDRPAAYMEDGVAIYRASAVGLCEEALVALRMGVSPAMPPEWLLKKFEEGQDWEEFIVRGALGKHLLDLHSTQEEALYQITPRVVIRGATDGRAEDDEFPGMPIGVEAKKLGPALFKEWDKSLENFWEKCPYYRDQLTVYMEALGYPFVYAVGEWDPDAEEVVAIHTEIIDTPPGDIVEIKKKILRVESRARLGKIGECDGSVSWPCPVHFLHVREERASVEADTASRLEELGSQYLGAHEAEKAAKDAKSALKKELIAVLTEGGYVKGDGDNIEVDPPEPVNGIQVTPYIHKYPVLDKARLKEDGVDLDEYTEQRQSVALRVTGVE